jgi:hypothetical protein
MSGNRRYSGRACDFGDKVQQKAQRRSDTRAGRLSDTGYQFDIDAWVALLEDHRLRIARAAGVEPSKVSIQVGH